MYFLELEVEPDPDGAYSGDAGGAQVTVWVRTDSDAAARAYCRRHLKDDGWIVRAVEQCRPCVRSDFEGNSESLARFDEAEADGGSIVCHIWPAEPQEGDAVH